MRLLTMIYKRRFGEPFVGPIVPLGAKFEYHPISTNDQARLHQFRKKVLSGICVGYALHAGETSPIQRTHSE